MMKTCDGDEKKELRSLCENLISKAERLNRSAGEHLEEEKKYV